MLTINDIKDALSAKVLCSEEKMSTPIKSCYVCDLLSWVVGRADTDCCWITCMTNLNVVAVAVMADIPLIVVTENIALEEAVISRAEREEIVILSTAMTTFKSAVTVGKLLESVTT